MSISLQTILAWKYISSSYGTLEEEKKIYI